MSDHVERTWTSDDGLALSARDYAGAAGPARLPVICIHGLTRNARDFELVAPGIAALGRRVLAVDVRGRGRSAWSIDPEEYAVPTYVEDVIALARSAGVSRAVFVGTSMGGLITMALAMTSPELVGAAVLNDIGAVLAPEGLARIMSMVGRPVEIETWDQAASFASHVNGAAFPDHEDADWAAFARRVFREQDGRPVLDYDPAIATSLRLGADTPTPDLWPLFEALTRDRPALLVRGGISDLLSAETAAEMRRRAPEMDFVETPGIGHAPMLTEPEAKAALHRFLDRVD